MNRGEVPRLSIRLWLQQSGSVYRVSGSVPDKRPNRTSVRRVPLTSVLHVSILFPFARPGQKIILPRLLPPTHSHSLFTLLVLSLEGSREVLSLSKQTT